MECMVLYFEKTRDSKLEALQHKYAKFMLFCILAIQVIKRTEYMYRILKGFY
jgi:hypothetical protein